MTTTPTGPDGDPDLPLTLRLAGRRVVVVGGGPLALRRVRTLLGARALVRLVAPEVVPELAAAAGAADVDWLARPYRDGDLADAWLAATATGIPAVDRAVAAEAERGRVFCLVGGDPDLATAWSAASARSGDVLVAVTAGRDPRRAATLRTAVAAALDAGDLPTRRQRRPAGPGRVTLVGGGPGDPGLITVRGRRALAEADVVVHDRLAPLALLEDLPDDVLLVDVGKSPGEHPVTQDDINALLVTHALAGQHVVRLKGGDPGVFGRGSEERAACEAAGLEVETISGVTSAIAVPAAVGIPVTARGRSRGFTVLTGHAALDTVPPDADHTVVLLMAVGRLAASAEELLAGGRPAATPVAVVEDGFGPRQRVTVATLGTIAEVAAAADVRPPAVVVVGDVVRECPAWTEHEAVLGVPAPAGARTGAGPRPRASLGSSARLRADDAPPPTV